MKSHWWRQDVGLDGSLVTLSRTFLMSLYSVKEKVDVC